MPIDLTLPPISSPALDPYKHISDPLLPFALYIHAAITSEEEITAIEDECNSQLLGSAMVKRAPRHNLQGQPLLAALTDHLINISARRFDPFYFAAVVDANWREAGVILVALDDGSDEEVCRIDRMRVPARDAGLVLVNVQLANVDWEEYKEDYGCDEGGNVDGDGDEDEDRGQERREEPFVTEPDGTDEEYSDGASKTLPNVGYWIGFYAIPGIDYETVMRGLCPAWDPPQPSSELICRPEGRVPAGDTAKALAEAERLHPMRCRNNPHLHRSMFLVIDTLDYKEKGVFLVRMKWDEKLVEDKNLSYSELSEYREDVETDTQRLPYLNSTTITIFNEIHAGYRPWKHTHKTFLAYAGPKTRYPSAYLTAADKTFKRRRSGSERFLEKNVQFPLTPNGSVTEDMEAAFEAVLEQHWSSVHEERFCATLCSNYFVFCDKELSAKDSTALLTLVKVDRSTGWSTMQCAAGDAYQTLYDLVEEKKEWQGTQVLPID
ncbi:hypothetical protein F5Y07DRAFT_379354 [Xylaria sp. FL0933]|nr:hypothetical protein F5Y07DRAFT_379354 [Xylaria sp. FL0933]